jgi:hypothetical protein
MGDQTKERMEARRGERKRETGKRRSARILSTLPNHPRKHFQV